MAIADRVDLAPVQRTPDLAGASGIDAIAFAQR
jgi:hypothetical protein